MIGRHLVLIGIIIAAALLVLATLHYPGGSQADINSIGYDWKNNYISNLFGEKSFNGAKSGSRFWAVGAMASLSISFTIFFFRFSKRIPARGSAKIIRFFGASGMVFSAFIATKWHDQMITIASTLFLVSIFYITVYVFKTRLYFFKFLCTVCLLTFYVMLFLFGAGFYMEFWPIVQKITIANSIILVVALEYYAREEDFQHIKAGK
ncbi:hypothetical protein [Dyadobacter arcticus]|uniref:DUF998 domain-containing protein n=1 Tax=Dyadobacter arcticus TaxID=1078754 RepID=A0ABX0ULL1_9BACT|nr:hypothetical protein [Dyadobacter arcticus]NIJ52854.1 hypothetical protein [Dyadobacter arcticus]